MGSDGPLNSGSRRSRRPAGQALGGVENRTNSQSVVCYVVPSGCGDLSVPSRYATKVLTKQPVPPTSRVALSESDQLGPAISRWTQGVEPTNCSRNFAAVIAPPHLPPTFFRSATWLLSCSL